MADERQAAIPDDERELRGLWLSRVMFGWMVGMPEHRRYEEFLDAVYRREGRTMSGDRLSREDELREEFWAIAGDNPGATDVARALTWLVRRVAERDALLEALRETEDTLADIGNWLSGSGEPTAAVVAAIDRRIGENRAVVAASSAVREPGGQEPRE